MGGCPGRRGGKHLSRNERKNADCPNWWRYLGRSDLFRVPDEGLRTRGYYELVRNWRIAAELGESLQARRTVLINLGPPQIALSASRFAEQLAEDAGRRFVHRTWDQVLAAAAPLPSWLENDAQRRRVISPKQPRSAASSG